MMVGMTLKKDVKLSINEEYFMEPTIVSLGKVFVARAKPSFVHNVIFITFSYPSEVRIIWNDKFQDLYII